MDWAIGSTWSGICETTDARPNASVAGTSTTSAVHERTGWLTALAIGYCLSCACTGAIRLTTNGMDNNGAIILFMLLLLNAGY
jgi:hypothetical protein